MISLMFHSFGAEPPLDVTGARYAGLWLTALLFVSASVLILAVVNFFSLLFGVRINFLGRNGVKFTFLHLFRRVPLVGITLPVHFGYVVWYNVKLNGALATAIPPGLTAIAAIVMLAAIVLVNNLVGARSGDR